jgi:hypothetical protein
MSGASSADITLSRLQLSFGHYPHVSPALFRKVLGLVTNSGHGKTSRNRVYLKSEAAA